MTLEPLIKAVEKATFVPEEARKNAISLAEKAVDAAKACSPEVFLRVHQALLAIERLYDEILSPVSAVEPPHPDAMKLISEIGEGERKFMEQVVHAFLKCIKR